MGWLSGFVDSIENAGQAVVDTVVNVVENVARNPAPLVETAILIDLGVPTNVAPAVVSAANGGKPQDIAASAIGGQVAGEVGPTGDSITSAASRGAIQGATASALTGKDVLKGAVSGGATSGLTAGVTQGYKSLLPDTTNYSIAPTQQSGFGLKATASTDPSNYEIYNSTGTTDSGTGVGATPSTSGYLLGQSTGGEGVQATGVSPNTQSPELGNTEKMLAGYVAKDIVRQAGLADTSGTTTTSAAQPAAQSATSNVALGSQASPTATTGADVAALDTTSAEGVGSIAGKKGGKYPWGDPEGTTALKQEGQVI